MHSITSEGRGPAVTVDTLGYTMGSRVIFIVAVVFVIVSMLHLPFRRLRKVDWILFCCSPLLLAFLFWLQRELFVLMAAITIFRSNNRRMTEMKKIILILVLTVCVAFQVTQLFYFPTIHMAAATGNLSALNRLANRDANRLSHFFYPPLYAAIINNQASAVDILLRNGADPNVICTMRSLLAEAIVRGERHIVLLMLKQGGNVNLKDQYQMTPLHYAITCGDPAVVEALLAHGANVMVRSANIGT